MWAFAPSFASGASGNRRGEDESRGQKNGRGKIPRPFFLPLKPNLASYGFQSNSTPAKNQADDKKDGQISHETNHDR